MDNSVKKKRERKGYFYEREENAVVEYLSTDSEARKNELFETILKPAFTKMIESIIRRYNLFIPDEEFQDTFDDTMSFLMMKLSYFDPSKNFKAYSYCGTICKNYLIYKINQFTKRQNRSVSYDNPSDNLKTKIDNSIDFSYTEEEEPFTLFNVLTSHTVTHIKEMLSSGFANETRKLTDNERKVGLAIISIFEHWEDLFLEMGSNKFNKSSIALYIKEMTMLSSSEVSKAMKLFKLGYYELKSSIVNQEP